MGVCLEEGPGPTTRKEKLKLMPWLSFLRPNDPETVAIQARGSEER